MSGVGSIFSRSSQLIHFTIPQVQGNITQAATTSAVLSECTGISNTSYDLSVPRIKKLLSNNLKKAFSMGWLDKFKNWRFCKKHPEALSKLARLNIVRGEICSNDKNFCADEPASTREKINYENKVNRFKRFQELADDKTRLVLAVKDPVIKKNGLITHTAVFRVDSKEIGRVSYTEKAQTMGTTKETSTVVHEVPVKLNNDNTLHQPPVDSAAADTISPHSGAENSFVHSVFIHADSEANTVVHEVPVKLNNDNTLHQPPVDSAAADTISPHSGAGNSSVHAVLIHADSTDITGTETVTNNSVSARLAEFKFNERLKPFDVDPSESAKTVLEKARRRAANERVTVDNIRDIPQAELISRINALKATDV